MPYYSIITSTSQFIVDSWDIAKTHQGKDIIKIKRFATQHLAQEYLNCDGEQFLDEKLRHIYTDGSCKNKVGTIGVFFGTNSTKNISEKLPGLQTNNTAELTAIIKALENCDDGSTIFSDSRYAIMGITKWMKKWKPSRINYELFLKIKTLSADRNIRFVQVPGHAGVYGNEQADDLAELAH